MVTLAHIQLRRTCSDTKGRKRNIEQANCLKNSSANSQHSASSAFSLQVYKASRREIENGSAPRLSILLERDKFRTLVTGGIVNGTVVNGFLSDC